MWISAVVGAGLCNCFSVLSAQVPSPLPRDSSSHDAAAGVAGKLLSDKHCPCQCGNFLPGTDREPSCFGCSVARAEISYTFEGLDSGLTPGQVSLHLSSPVLIDVFGDYTDSLLAGIWKAARQAAGDLQQTRVVLRVQGSSHQALMAARLAECAREQGKFFKIQESLLAHQGSWDEQELMRLAAEEGLDTTQVVHCLRKLDMSAQIAKDRQHAQERAIRRFPAVTVNREPVAPTYEAIRGKIEEVLLRNSI